MAFSDKAESRNPGIELHRTGNRPSTWIPILLNSRQNTNTMVGDGVWVRGRIGEVGIEEGIGQAEGRRRPMYPGSVLVVFAAGGNY